MLTKNGPFQLAAATFLEYQIGYGKPHLLGFGFPESKALKLATRLGLYAQVDQMVALHWPPAARRWSPRVYARPVTPNEAGIVNTLWEDMAAAFQNSIIGVRDWAFIAHRYLAHPTVSYQLLLVRHRWRHQPLAVVILRDRPQEEAVELVDMIATPEHFSIAVGWPAVLLCGLAEKNYLLGSLKVMLPLLQPLLPQRATRSILSFPPTFGHLAQT